MGDAKRRAESHRRIATAIDARMKQLDALKLEEVEIIGAMTEHMANFHSLMTNASRSSMDALCEEFAGFYRYAKIIESLATGIASGRIPVPGGKTINQDQRVAASIDERVRQLEAQGITGPSLLEHMVGHVMDLQRLWNTLSDDVLIGLCHRYPGLYRYV